MANETNDYLRWMKERNYFRIVATAFTSQTSYIIAKYNNEWDNKFIKDAIVSLLNSIEAFFEDEAKNIYITNKDALSFNILSVKAVDLQQFFSSPINFICDLQEGIYNMLTKTASKDTPILRPKP